VERLFLPVRAAALEGRPAGTPGGARPSGRGTRRRNARSPYPLLQHGRRAVGRAGPWPQWRPLGAPGVAESRG